LAFEVISSAYNIEDEVTGQPNYIQRVLNDITADDLREDFDGLMIVSGNMADTEAYWKDPKVLSLVHTAHEMGVPLAAICCSVPTIRDAAEGKKVSFFPLIRSRQLLSDAGAILQTVACTVDEPLVTAEHQMATQMWANAFSDIMLGRPHSVKLVDSGYMPKGRPRKPIPEIETLRRAKAPTDLYVSSGVDERSLIEYALKIQNGNDIVVHAHKKGLECGDLCNVLPGNPS
jgi:hypothetical protein